MCANNDISLKTQPDEHFRNDFSSEVLTSGLKNFVNH